MNTEIARIQHPTSNTQDPATRLKLFTQPEIFTQIGPTRVSMFLSAFADDLKTAGINLPSPDELPQFKSSPSSSSSSSSSSSCVTAPKSDEDGFTAPIPSQGERREPSQSAALLPPALPTSSNGQTIPPLPGERAGVRASVLSNPSSAATLLDALVSTIHRFVILPKHAAETLALWIVHTYAFHLRDVSTYIGLESPVKRCGKTTLLGVLGKLVNRPVVASNISPSAFFHVIEEKQPTLLIDEADTFLQARDELRGILNAGYHKPNAYVIRVRPEAGGRSQERSADRQAKTASSVGHHGSRSGHPEPRHPSNGGLGKPTDASPHSPSTLPGSPTPQLPDTAPAPPYSGAPTPDAHDAPRSTLATYSCWCPKAIAAIGHLPDTLADRCIVIRMQRKRGDEPCERLRNLDSDVPRNLPDSPILRLPDTALPSPSPATASRIHQPNDPIIQESNGAAPPCNPCNDVTLPPSSVSPCNPCNPCNDVTLPPSLSPATRHSARALRAHCAQFVLEHQHAIANARPEIPDALNDRAADIWEPLLAIADIAGGDWPQKARAAAVALTTGAQENSPAATLLFDIGMLFVLFERDRLFTSQIVNGLNHSRFATRPWMEARKGKPVTEIWLSQQLRPFGVRPKNLRMDGHQGKGYELPDLQEIFSRYVPRSELDNFKAELNASAQPIKKSA